MRKIRLEFPIEPKCVFFKIVGEQVELFSDVHLTKPFDLQGKTVCMDLQIPDDISVIQVFNPSDTSFSPIESIYNALNLVNTHNINSKSFSVIFDDREIEIPVENKKINPDLFFEKCQHLGFKNWALTVFETDDFKSGDLYWNF